MNQKNLEYLQDQVKYTGFGETLADAIKTKIEEGKDEFKLSHSTEYGTDKVSAELNFSKSNQSDMYFFNSYKVDLQKENPAENMEQTFYINKGNNITLREAYNLMEGRSVNKDLTNKQDAKYNAWLQLDFKQSNENGNFKITHFHENFGYNLEAELGKHRIKELENASYKENLMDSLKKGNLQSATFIKDGEEVKQFIEANPQFKAINIYDSAQQRIEIRQAQTEKQNEGTTQSAKKGVSTKQSGAAADEAPDIPDNSKKKKRGQKVN